MKISKLLCSLLVIALYVTFASQSLARRLEFSSGTTGIYTAELNMAGFELDIGLNPPKTSLKCIDKDATTTCGATKVSDAIVTIGADYVHVAVPSSGSSEDKCTQISTLEFGVESIVESNSGATNGFLVLYMPNGQNITMGERCITVDATQGVVGIDWLDEQMNCVTFNTDETTTPLTGCTAPAIGQDASSFVVTAKLGTRQELPEPTVVASPSAKPSTSSSTIPKESSRATSDPKSSHSHAQSSDPQGRESSNKSNDASKSFIYSAVAIVLVIGTIIASHLNLLRQ